MKHATKAQTTTIRKALAEVAAGTHNPPPSNVCGICYFIYERFNLNILTDAWETWPEKHPTSSGCFPCEGGLFGYQDAIQKRAAFRPSHPNGRSRLALCKWLSENLKPEHLLAT